MFPLLPGFRVTISIEADREDLAGEARLLLLDGWNVGGVTRRGGCLEFGAIGWH